MCNDKLCPLVSRTHRARPATTPPKTKGQAPQQTNKQTNKPTPSTNHKPKSPHKYQTKNQAKRNMQSPRIDTPKKQNKETKGKWNQATREEGPTKGKARQRCPLRLGSVPRARREQRPWAIRALIASLRPGNPRRPIAARPAPIAIRFSHPPRREKRPCPTSPTWFRLPPQNPPQRLLAAPFA